MRIGIDYTAAVRQGAGIGRYTRNLVGALAETDATNEYVLFSAGRDPHRAAWPHNFRTRELPLSDRHLALLWQRMRVPIPVEWLTGRLDIFHSPDFVLPAVASARTVLTVHDLSFIRYPECFSPGLLAYLTTCVPRSVSRADLVLADSQSTRDDLVELLHLSAERVAVVHAGVEPRFNAQQDRARVEAVVAKYGLHRPYILAVGTLQPRKNLARLIRAFGLLRDRHRTPHQLAICGGRGWLYEDIPATIRELHLEADVLLTGFVDDSDLPALYSGADVFALPSIYEGFGIPVLEAMSCGTPVVTSNVSSLPEVAGDAALMVDPADVEALTEALWRLIDDATLRHELVRRGFHQAQRFTWAAAAARLLQLYKGLAAV